MVAIVISTLVFCIYGSSAFVLDNGNNYNNSACDITKFSSCSTNYQNIMTITNTSTSVDPDAIYRFYCVGNNFTSMIQCMKDKLDPSCGPGTDNWRIRDSLSRVDPHMFDNLCRNDTAPVNLLSCQSKLPQVNGYVDCLTGKTLNKTIDPTDTCNFYDQTLGCSFKYTSFMCPGSLNEFRKETKSMTQCSLHIESTPEAVACDKDMAQACDVAYNPPQSLSGSTGGHSSLTAIFPRMKLFLCSSFGRAYLQCLDKVDNLCKLFRYNYHSNLPLVQQALLSCAR